MGAVVWMIQIRIYDLCYLYNLGHGSLKEPMNPLRARIPRFLWSTMIQVILHYTVSPNHDHSNILNIGCFPFQQKLPFASLKISCDEWNRNFKNFAGYSLYQIFRICLLGIIIPFDYGWMVCISGILETIPRNSHTIWTCFKIFQSFWLNGKYP